MSQEQAAGIVFSRDTAMEAARRSRHVDSILGPQGFMQMPGRALADQTETKPIDAARAVRLCADPALGAAFVPGAGYAVPALALHNESGAQIGRFVLCSDVRGRS
jgi:hypothetical protein